MSHTGLNQVSQAAAWNYPLEMLSPSEQRGTYRASLDKVPDSEMAEQKKSRQHSDLKGFIEITGGKVNCSIWSTESCVLQSQLLHGEELISTD